MSHTFHDTHGPCTSIHDIFSSFGKLFKTKKEGKNVAKEEWQLYFNFLHIVQDLEIWNNKKNHIMG
jgi:hypothetical protein